MAALIGVLFCLVIPSLLVGVGFYLGRYGSPVRIELRGPRRPAADDDMEEV